MHSLSSLSALDFIIGRLPRIRFGPDSLDWLATDSAAFGQRLLLVTGQHSLQQRPQWPVLQKNLSQAGLEWQQFHVAGEPSPELVDEAVQRFRPAAIQVVVGIGGGSVLDAAKAIAGLLPSGAPVMDYLEGVGRGKTYQGPALPFIAVPTTAGTGSEATKNAVLSRPGTDGFKKSFRDEALVPQLAVVDPTLLQGSPRLQIAANAMDALTQLLESYTSPRTNPFTDALAESGLVAIHEGLFKAHDHDDLDGYRGLAYGALLSGICLAQTGLGAVHGLASPLGAFFPIPHGVVCGTLLATTTQQNLTALTSRAPDHPALARYAQAASLLSGQEFADSRRAHQGLVSLLADWTERLSLPRLGYYGIQSDDFPRIVAHSQGNSMKTNPVVLDSDELTAILAERC